MSESTPLITPTKNNKNDETKSHGKSIEKKISNIKYEKLINSPSSSPFTPLQAQDRNPCRPPNLKPKKLFQFTSKCNQKK